MFDIPPARNIPAKTITASLPVSLRMAKKKTPEGQGYLILVQSALVRNNRLI
jgi:hypothetical protein